MRYLILGSEGFIGKSLVGYLSEIGNPVFRADVHDMRAKGYTRVDASRSALCKLVDGEKPDVLVNCAGAASVPASFEHPDRDFNLNTRWVLELLELLRVCSPETRFINLSSAAVYGNPERLPVHESAAVKPVSAYGFHKRMAELALEEYHSVFSLQTLSLRIFSAYGDGLRKQLFWDLHKKVKSGQSPVELFGTGHESRDFIYIRDLVRAIVIAAERGPMNGSSLNVASGQETSIGEAVRRFLSLYEPEPGFHFSAHARVGDPLNWLADISSLQKLGFELEWPIQKGLAAYHQWLMDSGE